MITFKDNHTNGPGVPEDRFDGGLYQSPCGDRKAGTFRVTSRYGWRTNPVTRRQAQFHNGIDLRTHNCPTSDGVGYVYCFEPGVVTRVVHPDRKFPSRFLPDGSQAPKIDGVQRGWTPFVEIRGEYTGLLYVYRHVRPRVSPGLHAMIGSPIGDTAQNYGYSTAAHLHLEVRSADGSQTYDPLPYLLEAGLKEVAGY